MIRIPGVQLHARTSAAWFFEITLALALGAVALVLAQGNYGRRTNNGFPIATLAPFSEHIMDHRLPQILARFSLSKQCVFNQIDHLRVWKSYG
jgi:hypothetical protein